ncbi:MAG TPA: hypothetical protein VGI39_21455 [Polyangiaceae bacterium]|jgi:hypothetical protein
MSTSRRLATLAPVLTFALASGCALSSSDPSASDLEAHGSTSSAISIGPIGIISTTIQGTLGRFTVGRSQSSGGGSGLRWFVSTPEHAMSGVVLSDVVISAAGGLPAILGKNVNVTGSSYDAHGALIASSVALASTQIVAKAAPLATGTGTKHWVTVLCRFSDLPSPDPHPQSYFQSLMGNTNPGLGDYWSKASNGALSFDGSQVLDWQDMPLPASQYNVGTSSEKIADILGDCIGLAASSVDFSQVDGFAFAFSHNLDAQIAGGPPDDQTGQTFGMAVLSPVEFDNQASVARTVGMGLGLRLSGSDTATFDSPWDVMSYGYGTTNGSTCRTLTPSMGCAAVLPAAEWTVQEGWASAAQIASVSANGSGTYNLDFGGAAPASGHYRVLHLPIDATHYYTLEARSQSTGTYDVGVPSTALVLQSFDATDPATVTNNAEALALTTPLHLLAAIPDGSASPYTNAGLRLRIAFTRQSFGYTVTVSRGPVLTVTNPGSTLLVSGGGIGCGRGQTTCSVNGSFDTPITLMVSNVPNYKEPVWSGCTSTNGNYCTVGMSASAHVSVTLESIPDDGGCHCPPTMPAFKCQQLCGDP